MIEVSIRNFFSLEAETIDIHNGKAVVDIKFITTEGTALTLCVFGEKGRIVALSNCLNNEFHPQQEPSE